MELVEKGPHGGRYARVPLWLFILLLLLIVLGTAVLWSIWSAKKVRLSVHDAGELNALLPSIAGLTESAMEPGNKVQLLETGDGFVPLLLRDIAAAKETVHVETYIWWKGAICRQIADALSAKARQGVEVRLLVDASGGHKMQKELLQEMAAAGV